MKKIISQRSFLVLLMALLLLQPVVIKAAPSSISVDSYGAVGDGATDDTAAIQNAINACTGGGTLQFSAKTYYVSALNLNSNCTYLGVSGATLKLKTGGFILNVPNGGSNITIDTLILDGNNIGGGFGAYGNAGLQNSIIQNSTFKNVPASAVYPNNVALISTYTTSGVQILKNTFNNVASGIIIFSPSNLTVTGNTVNTVTEGDWIETVNNDPNLFASGVNISNNSGTDVARMAIEVWDNADANAGGYNNPIVSNNNFTWNTNNLVDQSFGISLDARKGGGHVTGNTLTGTGDSKQSYGIEMASPGAVAQNNTITGFQVGIVVQGFDNTTVDGNTITGSYNEGIEIANTGSTNNTTITNNIITNPQSVGIAAANPVYNNSLISGNTIQRAGGFWANDNMTPSVTPWYGIKVNNYGSGATAVTMSNNKIIQTAATVPAPFTFWGFWVPVDQAGNTFSGNIIQSNSTAPLGSGFDLWFHQNLDNNIVSGNTFINLASIDDGYTSSAIQKSNNYSYGVTNNDSNIVTTAFNFLPTTAPLISNITSTSTIFSATITWTTDQPSDSTLNYGLTSSYGSTAASSSSLALNHVVTLNNLSPLTPYHFQIQSSNIASTTASSQDMMFSTLQNILPPPPVSGGGGSTGGGGSSNGGSGVVVQPVVTSASSTPSASTPVFAPVLNSATPPYPTGSLINDKGTIFLIIGSKKIPFTNYPAFTGLGYSLKNVINADSGYYTLAQTYWIESAQEEHPWSSWVAVGKTVYYVSDSGLIGVPTYEVFLADGGSDKLILPANAQDKQILQSSPNLPILTTGDSRLIH